MNAEEKDADEGEESVKPLFWIASSKDDLRAFPEDVKDVMGFALYQAQKGAKHVAAKPLKGFGVLESSKSSGTMRETLSGQCTQ